MRRERWNMRSAFSLAAFASLAAWLDDWAAALALACAALAASSACCARSLAYCAFWFAELMRARS